MFPSKFDYHRASSVDEAVQLLESGDGETKLIAGGHSLLPMMKQRLSNPDTLVDIGRIDGLRGITYTRGDTIRIGPLTTHSELASSGDLKESATALAQAAHAVGDVQVRNKGTIGGNLAHADPASDLPAPFLALGGTVHARGPSGNREIAAEDFFFGLFMTELNDNEIITEFEVPAHSNSQTSAYVKNASPSSGYAIVGIAAVLDVQGGTIQSARVAANGVMNQPTRLTALEDALQGSPTSDDAIEQAAESAADGLDVNDVLDDQQASADYRLQLVKVYSKRAVQKALS